MVPHHKVKRALLSLLAVGGAFFALVILFVLLFDGERYLSSRIAERFNECSRLHVEVTAKPRFKMWLGSIDNISLSAEGVKDFALPLKKLEVEARDISFDPLAFPAKKLGAIRTLSLRGSLSVSGEDLQDFIAAKVSKHFTLRSALHPGVIVLDISTPFARSLNLSLRGGLAVRNGTELYITLPEKTPGEKKTVDMLLALINPVFDFSSRDLTGYLLKDLPMEARTRWKTLITGVEVRDGELEILFTIDAQDS
ncbi:MAG: DUF2993 domain-containing protein [Candidatus Eremiobacteraeota bacterium]|nr:DUF2993 domain-containing protein [Candidatus Eremiobacteraeota bacterium]